MADENAETSAEQKTGDAKGSGSVAKTALTIIVTGVLTVLGTWIKQKWIDPFPLTVRTVYLSPTGETVGLANSHVDPHFNNISGQNTNDDGEVVFQSIEPHWFDKVTIEARHPGYEYADVQQKRLIPVRKRDNAVIILMRPAQIIASGASVPAPTAYPDIPTASKEAEPRKGANLDGHADSTKAVSFSSSCHSGLMASGDGRNFGPLFTLCSDSPSCTPPLPQSGYVIQSEHFSLEGDRQCGAWSECTKIENSKDKVCYSFRMQGHSEWGGPLGIGGGGVALSGGVLNLTWVKE